MKFCLSSFRISYAILLLVFYIKISYKLFYSQSYLKSFGLSGTFLFTCQVPSPIKGIFPPFASASVGTPNDIVRFNFCKIFSNNNKRLR